MTVDQLLDQLVDVDPDAKVYLMLDGKVSDEFVLSVTEGAVTLTDQLWAEEVQDPPGEWDG